jgi:mono/diheme cytochrome c family protein
MQAWHQNIWLAAALGVLLVVFGLVMARRLSSVVAAVLMALGLLWFGAFEMFRESIRKPFIVTGYIYGNGALVAKTAQYQKDGFLSEIHYKTGDEGADLFRHACRSCHTLTGYKPLKPVFDGTDKKFIAGVIRSARFIKGNMPPFLGTPSEAEKIAAYLDVHIDHAPITDGARAYRVRCAICHPLGTTHDKSKSFNGQSVADLGNMLDLLPVLSKDMPAYTGGAAERALLISYLQQLGKQVKP